MKQIATILILITTLQASAQKSLNVLDWKPETTLNNYLVQQMHEQYDQRRIKFSEALRSAKSMRAYIERCRNNYLALLGPMPARTPLRPEVTGVITEAGYRIEKISFESFPGHHVTTNLYIPYGKGPFPAVLLFCGHEDAAKATESYQQTAILFARSGYVVLAIDPVSQAERYQLFDAAGKPATRGGTTEHTLLNEASNLLGESTPKDELWDNVRSLDYLVSRKEVDTARIGCLGNSGGGMQTIYFAGFDQRIKIMAPCSYVATRERTLELTGPADGCAQMPDEGKAQLEFADYLLMAAPRPLLILAGRYDFIDYRGAEEAYGELKKAYTILGKPAQVELFTYDDGHGISRPKREAAVNWFNRWLKNDTKPVSETPAAIKTPAQLKVTATGQLGTSSGERNIIERNDSLFHLFASQRSKFQEQVEDRLKFIAQFAGVNYQDRKVATDDKGLAVEHGLTFQKRIIHKKNEPPLPVLVLFPGITAKQAIIWCDESGKLDAAAKADTLRALLDSGNIIVLADLRGTGETQDKPEFNDAKYYNHEYRNVMLALHTGRSLVGQRATDILSVVDLLRSDMRYAALPVTVKASGINALPALHAALFGKFRVELRGGIHSWKEVLDRPTDRDWYSYVIPGVLKYYDIADLLTLLDDRVRWLN